jgi:hypothetical protein
MGQNNKSGKNRFKTKNESEFERVRNTREEKKVKEELPKLVFSFKDIDIRQIPPGQTFNDWQDEKILAYMLEKFGHICALNIVEAQQQKVLKIYGKFPEKSEFETCQHIAENVTWAVIMDIKGQRGRVAGHIIDNVFYVVFLDKDHRFYITQKR